KADPAAAAAAHNFNTGSFANPFANGFASFDPMTAWTNAQQNFQKLMSDAYARTQAWADEYATIEAQMFARANQAVDTWAQLAHDSLTYTANLSAQARKIGFEAVRKTGFGA
ncbi:MAG: hypothetical protein HOV81_26735, partial [Kofleriaceae bacterium]|nr:hypothetical protein [Kofleriaceae bacterium]